MRDYVLEKYSKYLKTLEPFKDNKPSLAEAVDELAEMMAIWTGMVRGEEPKRYYDYYKIKNFNADGRYDMDLPHYNWGYPILTQYRKALGTL